MAVAFFAAISAEETRTSQAATSSQPETRDAKPAPADPPHSASPARSHVRPLGLMSPRRPEAALPGGGTSRGRA
jgi:hypothetical protein